MSGGRGATGGRQKRKTAPGRGSSRGAPADAYALRDHPNRSLKQLLQRREELRADGTEYVYQSG